LTASTGLALTLPVSFAVVLRQSLRQRALRVYGAQPCDKMSDNIATCVDVEAVANRLQPVPYLYFSQLYKH